MKNQKSLNILFRIFAYSIVCFWKIVFSRRFADGVYALHQDMKAQKQLPPTEETAEQTEAEPETVAEPVQETVKPAEPAPVAEAPPVKEPVPEKPTKPEAIDGIYLLSLFQKSGRLIDFLQQDIAAYSNAEVGEACRVVHEGCVSVMNQYFTIEPIRSEEEGARVTIEADYKPAEIRVTGNVAGKPPYSGELVHHGWIVADHKLPELTEAHDRNILAPAEVEV